MSGGAVLPSLQEAERRETFGANADPTTPAPYVVELNLMHRGGLGAADAQFRELFNEVVPPDASGQPRMPVQVSTGYYACLISAKEWQELVHRDERPAGEGNLRATRDRAIYRIWPDFPVRHQIYMSVATVKGDAALRSYGAGGDGVVWAVVDSGIEQRHCHFGDPNDPRNHALLHDDVADLHRFFGDLPGGAKLPDVDSVSEAEARKSLLDEHRRRALTDELGHGTHVAGIIAGGALALRQRGSQSGHASAPAVRVYARRYETDEDGRKSKALLEERTATVDPLLLRGVAPFCKLVSIKIHDQTESARASHVMRALSYIREKVNASPKVPRIQGVNLSLGYEFDAEMFACGQSPLCVEIDRLVQTGVVVVVAAGNTGYTALSAITAGNRTMRVGMSHTINDPGNAALAITVGSTHRDRPHTYGVSYFSSKGPTGDGRLKPDLLAPGERITSCAVGKRLNWIRSIVKTVGLEPLPEDDGGSVTTYLDENGTSQAAPHVSGAIAAFLSIRQEFVGKPGDVKRVFLESATPLGRERYFEGHGLVDLMRAIQSV